MGMLSLGSDGSQMRKIPRSTPLGSPEGLGAIPTGYTCTHPLRTRLSLTLSRPPLGARGLARAPRLPIYADTMVWLLAPAWQTTPAKAQAQEGKPRATEARGLPGAAPWARHCRSLCQQGHARGVTQEDKAS
jgi:hypothetical protein